MNYDKPNRIINYNLSFFDITFTSVYINIPVYVIIGSFIPQKAITSYMQFFVFIGITLVGISYLTQLIYRKAQERIDIYSIEFDELVRFRGDFTVFLLVLYVIMVLFVFIAL